jgi:hypothetical protein
MSSNFTSLTGDWKTDIKDWTKISEKTATLMLTQSELVLKEKLETAKSISQKAEKILTILIPITTALITFLFSKKLNEILEFLPLTALLCLPILLISIIFSYYNFLKYEIAIPGEYPKNIATTTFIDQPFTSDQQYVNMVLNICENIQRRIDINEESNRVRRSFNIRSIKTLGLLILCPVISYLLSPVLLHVFQP